MSLSHKVKRCAPATNNAAPMPPIDATIRYHRMVMLIVSITNSFSRGCRGDIIGRRLAPYAVLSFALIMFTINPAFAQSTTDTAPVQYQKVDQGEPLPVSSQLDPDGTLSADDNDLKRVKALSRYFPPQIGNAILQSRQANRKGPLMVFRHWAQERKPFVATFLFCMFVGLLGSAFFPKQVFVAQECCRSQFWKCLGKAILVGMTLVITVRILDLLLITHPLTTVLLGLLELVLVAGLAVGVSLLGEGVTRNNLARSDYFKTHPRIATVTRIMIGSLILALIVQVPGAGLLPRIGIRIALLVALLGAGGLLKTKFGTQPASEA